MKNMRSLFTKTCFVFAFLNGAAAQAHEPSLEDALKVLDYAEQLYSNVLPVSSYEAGEAVEFGYRWYYRYYKDADSYIAVNRDDAHLWVLGPHFGTGTEATKVMPVHTVLALLSRPGGEPIRQEADEIFDFAEESFPELFPAPYSYSGQPFEFGYRWFFRYYNSTATYLAVNLDDGFVWAMGAGFGAEPVRLMSVGDAVNLIPSMPGGEGSSITNPGNGNCVAITEPRNGTQAVYRSAHATGERLEYRRAWVESSPSIQKMTSETFIDGELSGTAESASYYELHNGLRYMTRHDSRIQEFSLTPPNYNTQTTYRPSQLIGPADEYCEGQEWKAASVLQTSVRSFPSLPNTAQRNQSIERTYIVESVNELISVPAGIFTTIKITSLSNGGAVRLESWVEASTGLPVLSRTYWGGSMRNNQELMEVSY